MNELSQFRAQFFKPLSAFPRKGAGAEGVFDLKEQQNEIFEENRLCLLLDFRKHLFEAHKKAQTAYLPQSTNEAHGQGREAVYEPLTASERVLFEAKQGESRGVGVSEAREK